MFLDIYFVSVKFSFTVSHCLQAFDSKIADIKRNAFGSQIWRTRWWLPVRRGNEAGARQRRLREEEVQSLRYKL